MTKLCGILSCGTGYQARLLKLKNDELGLPGRLQPIGGGGSDCRV
jgi:hypothetical protein